MRFGWYLNRLRRMTPQEVTWRIRDEAVKRVWRGRKGKPADYRLVGVPSCDFAPLDPARLAIDPAARAAVIAAAEGVLGGRIPLFERDMPLPKTAADWFTDPDSGRIAPSDAYTFDTDARDPSVVGNLTFTPSRLIHVTLLGAGYLLTGRDAFAELAAAQLRLWWEANPFLTGIHWSAGIELGLRLVAFAWTRRLLAGWSGVGDLFENSPLARDQIYHHQFYLAGLRSYGSSANNHLIAEYLGLYVGGCVFPWFAESADWRQTGRAGLVREAQLQVFPDGFGRELASEYHGFTMELLMLGAIEGRIVGESFDPDYLGTIARMADAWAASLDVSGRPPRQGDTDDAYALLLDPPGRTRRASGLLSEAAALVGPVSWWPTTPRNLGGAIFTAVAARHPVASTPLPRSTRRPNLFPEAGLAFLRDLDRRPDEIWCRCDAGPQGYLAIAAHGHADALSVELRHAGVDLLVDPGTYCYLTDPDARYYFRSTIAHNTLEIGRTDQANYGGSFLWLDATRSETVSATGLDDGPVAVWQGRHEGYRRQKGGPVHCREVTLDRVGRRIEIADSIAGEGGFAVRLAYHLGPEVAARRDGNTVELRWSARGVAYSGRLTLPEELSWEEYKGSSAPMLGWYSPAFHERVPIVSFVGSGMLPAGVSLVAAIQIDID
jgi:Heparinase II/III-like protein/Heparinase II/III N-terminus